MFLKNNSSSKSLKTQLYKSIRDSFASEYGARVTAMHKATDNATDVRDALKLTYNKARQVAITNEILEIVWWCRSFERIIYKTHKMKRLFKSKDSLFLMLLI